MLEKGADDGPREQGRVCFEERNDAPCADGERSLGCVSAYEYSDQPKWLAGVATISPGPPLVHDDRARAGGNGLPS